MEQQLRRPWLVTLLLVFLPVVLSAVHGVDVPADGKDIGLLHEQMAAPAWTKQTRTSLARWSVTVRKGGHGHGHGHGNGGGSGRGHEMPPVFNPRTIAGTTKYHHKRSAAPGPELGRSSTVVATCCVFLLAVALLL